MSAPARCCTTIEKASSISSQSWRERRRAAVPLCSPLRICRVPAPRLPCCCPPLAATLICEQPDQFGFGHQLAQRPAYFAPASTSNKIIPVTLAKPGR